MNENGSEIDWEGEQEQVNALSSRLVHLQTSIEEEEALLTKAERRHGRALQAQEILQLTAQAVQQRAHEKISEVVSSCLSSVFDNAYSFKIAFEQKRGKTEASLRFCRGELEIDPLTASGGGMVDVAAFALRVACLVLHRPRLSKVVVLDEGFKFVSAQYRENIRLMLDGLSRDLGIQIIQVTHMEELEMGGVITLEA